MSNSIYLLNHSQRTCFNIHDGSETTLAVEDFLDKSLLRQKLSNHLKQENCLHNVTCLAFDFAEQAKYNIEITSGQECPYGYEQVDSWINYWWIESDKKLVDDKTAIKRYNAIANIATHGKWYDEWTQADLFMTIRDIVNGQITDFSSKNIKKLCEIKNK